MKKIICFVFCIALLVSLTGCNSNLPKGKASNIDFIDGWTINSSTFEYVNENTVKIVRENGQVLYVPNSYIKRIWVKE